MLQETVHNTGNPNIPTKRFSRHQAADSSYNQINLYPCLTGTIQLIYHSRILQGIHLQNNPARLSLFHQIYFPLNEGFQFRKQIETCYQQAFETGLCHFLPQDLKQGTHVVHYLLVAGIQSYIGINLCCLLIKITRTDIRVAS